MADIKGTLKQDVIHKIFTEIIIEKSVNNLVVPKVIYITPNK